MSNCFEGIPKQFGFGFMRLPMHGDQVDIPQTCQMVDEFLEAGFAYFDTAHGYLDGKSELAIHECLTSRYPRDRYFLADKLSANFFEKEEDIRPLFEQQLEACGVEYFDFYLMHALSGARRAQYRNARAIETALELKKEGKIRHLAMSFHDTADVLDAILTEYPQIEAVQLQFNYLDFDDPKVQSEKCYEVCLRHGKPVIVMEPVKGGSLVNLPPQPQKVLDQLEGGSNASYALRFAAGFDNIAMVLSGMSTIEQLRDNIAVMAQPKALDSRERDALKQVVSLLRVQDSVPCTACRYCTEVCPQGIAIPEIFAALNAKRTSGTPTPAGLLPYQCIRCGECENSCPQALPIRDLLETAAKELG